MELNSQHHGPCCLTPLTNEEKNLAPAGNGTLAIQPEAHRYANRVTLGAYTTGQQLAEL
jgi:hypothetical protein